jgi:hypothetical protein
MARNEPERILAEDSSCEACTSRVGAHEGWVARLSRFQAEVGNRLDRQAAD